MSHNTTQHNQPKNQSGVVYKATYSIAISPYIISNIQNRSVNIICCANADGEYFEVASGLLS
ncbi:MAG: hypothetical protein LBQ66_11675 [Planctomycetaceae bacterium]|nr:hypothetical protein [Planctomycetaceae bacterium]